LIGQRDPVLKTMDNPLNQTVLAALIVCVYLLLRTVLQMLLQNKNRWHY